MKIKSLERLGLPISFPSFFPPAIEWYRRTLAEGTGTPDEFAAAQLAVAAATAIGANTSAKPTSTWSVRANLFCCMVGCKGGNKSVLAELVLVPIVAHEEALAKEHDAASSSCGACCDDYDDDDDEDDDGDGGYREDDDGDNDGLSEAAKPCLITNDCTVQAVLELVKNNPRQLLVNPDEMAALWLSNQGGGTRQVWCELADGRRRRRHRVTGDATALLEAPHVCVLGGLTPDLLRVGYSARGDDGFLDRFLIVGDGQPQRPGWPRDLHDPDASEAWARLIARLFTIEKTAMDAVDGKLVIQVHPNATQVFGRLIERLNQIADAVNMPESQRGTVSKMRQFAVKFALIHRCLRWAVGEFGVEGPVGEISPEDAEKASEVVLFLFGRWLLWRPEMSSGLSLSCEPIGLAAHPGDDPVLLAIEAEAAGAQAGIRLIERLARFLRAHGPEPVSIAALTTAGPMAMVPRAELQAACEWLVSNGLVAWANGSKEAISMPPLPARHRKSPRRPRAPATLVQSGGREIEL